MLRCGEAPEVRASVLAVYAHAIAVLLHAQGVIILESGQNSLNCRPWIDSSPHEFKRGACFVDSVTNKNQYAVQRHSRCCSGRRSSSRKGGF
jgi:hypothetical protein